MESHFHNMESESEYMGRRKGRKLMAEKRRRARINQSLSEIKGIVCAGHQQNDPNFEKMEKAEILETTVDYLRNVRKINTTHQHVKEAVQARFQHGFSKCAEEILSYIQSLPGVSDNVHRQLRKHISRHMTHIQQVPVTSPMEDRLHSVPSYTSQYPHPAAHAYMGTSPVKEDNSFSDSGYAGSPDITKQPTHRTGHYPSSSFSDSVLSKVPTEMVDKNSRVRSWLQSTWSYSQQIQTEQQVPWRPW
ncbi:enhancer of split mgamma protein-like [Haliotis rubra]|uniref:enhancer of split mgamma protein-like n=1 Tax=Haliotis rubra TaxID=36100 RepID=UPI001EE5D2AD|nr:enhancer of split mgamma protein-like [Haliotis rubra]